MSILLVYFPHLSLLLSQVYHLAKALAQFGSMNGSTFGYIAAIGSAFLNGSFTSPWKHLGSLQLHPIVFQLYCSCGVFLSSWLAVPLFRYNAIFCESAGRHFVVSPLGVFSGMIFVLANFSSFNAVKHLGKKQSNTHVSNRHSS